jgi:hypothetical protein
MYQQKSVASSENFVSFGSDDLANVGARVASK